MAVRIRLAHDNDADAVAAIYRPIVEQTAISFETVAPDRYEMARRIVETLRHYPWLVCERDRQMIGYAYAARHRVRAAYQWSVDTSVYIDREHRRSGVGRGLYLSLLGVLAAQGYFNAYAGIALPNDSSVALHESMGFEPLGVYRRVGYKLGEWRDVGWWQLNIREHAATPTDPLTVMEVQRQPTWHAVLTRGESAIRGAIAA
jgi:L-amino acid N-acyltransferase YncA